ncbi:hypothetical protein Pcinc_040266 [Petrolisthes cinctipes]|uniref:BHLH domain-containing protein n=1 Tax=Petrolisthes cinctipes TaxID=88211 RepID=A0AAE1EKZ8_PETCI|nr:hypothetical protein Pcinc_040266 [Petrolisthes cinctipes]
MGKGETTGETASGGGTGNVSEMRVYLDKLRELVPYVPRSGRVSRVTLIHSAIDYITDLQEALEARARRKLRDKTDPNTRPPLAALPQSQHQNNTQTQTTTPTEHTEHNTRPPLASLSQSQHQNNTQSTTTPTEHTEHNIRPPLASLSQSQQQNITVPEHLGHQSALPQPSTP